MRRLLLVLCAGALVLTACFRQAPETIDEGERAADDGTFTVVAGDMYFEGMPHTIEPGTVEFTLENVGEAPHNITIAELDDLVVVEAEPGETATGTVELGRGMYTFYCSVPGHREQMEEVVHVN